MKSAEFRKHAMKITGCPRGWHKPLAERLGISLGSVEKYSSGHRKIPLVVEKLIIELVKNSDTITP